MPIKKYTVITTKSPLETTYADDFNFMTTDEKRNKKFNKIFTNIY